jgi:hypothetical protein
VKHEFDYLVKLFKEDPQKFEKCQRAAITEFIESRSTETHKQRLRCFQWKLEQELNHYKDPIARLNIMVEKFWAGVINFDNVLKGPPPPKNSNNVISFTPKKKVDFNSPL